MPEKPEVITVVNSLKDKILGNAHPNSEHLYGNAIDFKIIGQDINSVYANIESFWKGRHYVHKLYGFIHVDRTKEHGDNVNW